MSTYSTYHWVTGSSHPLDRKIGGYCRGLVPRVPQATSYSPPFWIRLVHSSRKWLGNNTLYIGYGSTTPGWRGGGTNLKKIKLGSNPHLHFPHCGRRGQAGFHHLSARSTSFPILGRTQASSHPARGLSEMDRLYWRRRLGKRWHLLPDAMRYGHRNPCMSNNTYSSAGTRPHYRIISYKRLSWILSEAL
jgi:hypothetical protein